MNRRMDLSRNEREELRRIIQEKTGYFIRSEIFLTQIFSRSSFASETGQNSNEIFEFIGDEVLSFYVVKIVSEKIGSISPIFGYTFRIRENRFTQIKQELVNNERLAIIIDEWDIAKYLLLGKSDINNAVANGMKIRADLLESIIGAIAIESNWNAEILESAVSKALKIDETISAMIESDIKVKAFDIDNAITVLKELAEKGQCTMPIYEFTEPCSVGYDSNGNERWFCQCRVISDITGLTKLVEASTKKDAKKAAAYLILCELLGVQNKYGQNDWFTIWKYKDGKLIPDRGHSGKGE